MTKRPVDIDDELMEDARPAFGITVTKENRRVILRSTVRREHVTRSDLHRASDLLADLSSDEILDNAWSNPYRWEAI